MKITLFITCLTLLPALCISSQCPPSPLCTSPSSSSSSSSSPNDTAILLTFAYTIQNLLYTYYTTTATQFLTPAFLSTLPDATAISPANNLSLATNTATNLLGLSTQSRLALEGISSLFSPSSSITTTNNCTFSLPTPSNATSLLTTAYHLEATLCGAFISLAAYSSCYSSLSCYTSSSTTSTITTTTTLLMSRLAADHGTHAAYLHGLLLGGSPLFNPMSESLVPVFSPTNVTTTDAENKVGNLGVYLGACVLAGLQVPRDVCGGGSGVAAGNSSVVAGMSSSAGGGGGGGGMCAATSTGGPSSMAVMSSGTASATLAQFTGGGTGRQVGWERGWVVVWVIFGGFLGAFFV